MGSGSWGSVSPNVSSASGATPTALDAYHLSTLIQPVAVVKHANIADLQEFSLTNASQFIKLETNDTKQYFLVQPRGDVGYDRGLRYGWNNTAWNEPRGGLIIYHIDESRFDLEGGLNPNLQTRPLFDIEEAHADPQNLQNNSGWSTPDDLFDNTKTFTKYTVPNSNLYDSETTANTQSGVVVTAISPVVTVPNSSNGTVKVGFKVGETTSTVPVTGITLNYSSIDLNLDDTVSLIATLSPENASNKIVIWSTSDNSVARVVDGLVTAEGAGTATSSNSSQTAACTIHVTKIPVEFISASANGDAENTSTVIDLTFDTPISGLEADAINIASSSSNAAKGAVNGSGKNWNVAISNVSATGNVSVTVSDFGPHMITSNSKSVVIYKQGQPYTPTTDETAVAADKEALTWDAIKVSNTAQIDGGGVFADIVRGTAIIATINSTITNGVVSAQTTGVDPADITAGLVISGATNAGKVYGNTSVRVNTAIPYGITVSFEPGGVLNVEFGTTTLNGSFDTTDGTLNVSGSLDGTGDVTGNGYLVKKSGGYIAASLNVGQDVNYIDESPINPPPPSNEDTGSGGNDGGGCNTGTGIFWLFVAVFASLGWKRRGKA
jgi:hypothetical protein